MIGCNCVLSPLPIKFARRVDVGSTCVDKRPSPKTDVLVSSISDF